MLSPNVRTGSAVRSWMRGSVSLGMAGTILVCSFVPVSAATVRCGNAGIAKLKTDATRVVVQNGYFVKLDLREQSFDLNALDPIMLMQYVQPTLSENYFPGFLPAAMLAIKSKQFDDGLMGAVEVACESGKGKLASKRLLLKSISTQLQKTKYHADDSANALKVVLGATSLGDASFKLNSQWRRPVAEFVKGFEVGSNDRNSKPIGFYTWSPQLRTIFRQDRLLQTKLNGSKQIELIRASLRNVPGASQAYNDHLSLYSQLTNPFRAQDLRHGWNREIAHDSEHEYFAFFPPSQSPEDTLVRQLAGSRASLETFNLSDELVARIQSGALNLAPKANSGWYTYQLWALEPLLRPERMPEGQRLNYSSGYKLQLVELFKGLMALSRETQIKNLSVASGAGETSSERTVHIDPGISVEPLTSYYLRKSVSYDFIAKVLEKHFGLPALKQMHRLTPSGQSKVSLYDEIQEVKNLFLGAYVASGRELGMSEYSLAKQAHQSVPQLVVLNFERWAKRANRDPDVASDVRMMVPIFYDPSRKQTKVWVMLGWIPSHLSISWTKHARLLEWNYVPVGGKIHRKGSPELIWDDCSESSYFPLITELYVDNVLNRDEFRKVCDITNPEALVARLTAPKKTPDETSAGKTPH